MRICIKLTRALLTRAVFYWRRLKMVKRPLEDYSKVDLTVSDFTEASPKAKVHCVVSSLSPMKESRGNSYFQGEVTDGKSAMRVYGYNPDVRKKLQGFKDNKTSVAISNCEVKRSQTGDDLEIFLGNKCQIVYSNKDFDLSKGVPTKVGRDITVAQLCDMDRFRCVALKVKAINVEEPGEVPGGKIKQDITIADGTGCARLTVWGADIGRIENGKSYHLTGMTVREFRGRKFLSTPIDQTSDIIAIDDIGEVSKTDIYSEEDSGGDAGRSSQRRVCDARVVGVLHIDRYPGCLKCNTKLIPCEDDTELGYCQKCNMTQFIDSGKSGLNVRLLVEGGGEKITLRAFGKVIENIADQSAVDISMSSLLKAKPFNMTYVDGIIQSINRKA